MSPPVTPQADFTDYAQLASRISRHLAANPSDQQARDDLRYIQSKMAGPAGLTAAANAADTGPAPSAHPGFDVAAGLTEAATDIPRAVGQAIMHPIDTAGQLTGLGNVGRAWQTFQDPEASWAEKADAAVRATPLNIGYAPERSLLEATGAKSDDPASLEEQAHRTGNVASLALLGVNPSAPLRVLRGGVQRMVGGRLLGAVADALRKGPEPAPGPAAPGTAPGIGSAEATPPAGTGGWTRELALKMGVRPENVDAFLARQAPVPQPGVAPTVPEPTPGASESPPPVVPPASLAPEGMTSPPRVTGGLPLPGSPKGMTAIGPPTPPPPTAPTATDMLTRGTLPYYTRGGQVEQAGPPGPVSSMPPSPARMVEASRPLAEALGSYTGGGMEAVADALQHPAYQHAELLAARALGQGYPVFKGMSLSEATNALRRMIVERAEAGGDVPALTTLPRFLQRLQTAP